MKPTVYVAGDVPDEIRNKLREEFEVVEDPSTADGVLAMLTARIDAAFLSRSSPPLRIVANSAAGVDNIDLEACAARDILVTHTPEAVTVATAEFTIALILALLRRLPEGDRLVRRGSDWGFTLDFMLGSSLAGKKLTVVGPGRIGRRVGSLAEAFGARISYVGRRDPLLPALGEADIVSLHCPLNPGTRHLIDEQALAAMRPESVLINTSRGAVVDELALVDALVSRRIAGAALDVFEFEPAVSRKLLEMDHVVLTPHMASATRDARGEIVRAAIDALRDVLIVGRAPQHVFSKAEPIH